MGWSRSAARIAENALRGAKETSCPSVTQQKKHFFATLWVGAWVREFVAT
jgi:hypothetical protein